MSAKSQPQAARPSQPAPSTGPAAAIATRPDEKRLKELTAKIAYELYEKRGRKDGQAMDDWLSAEKIARERLASGKA
jgi:hypothetical protein